VPSLAQARRFLAELETAVAVVWPENNVTELFYSRTLAKPDDPLEPGHAALEAVLADALGDALEASLVACFVLPGFRSRYEAPIDRDTGFVLRSFLPAWLAAHPSQLAFDAVSTRLKRLLVPTRDLMEDDDGRALIVGHLPLADHHWPRADDCLQVLTAAGYGLLDGYAELLQHLLVDGPVAPVPRRPGHARDAHTLHEALLGQCGAVDIVMAHHAERFGDPATTFHQAVARFGPRWAEAVLLCESPAELLEDLVIRRTQAKALALALIAELPDSRDRLEACFGGGYGRDWPGYRGAALFVPLLEKLDEIGILIESPDRSNGDWGTPLRRLLDVGSLDENEDTEAIVDRLSALSPALLRGVLPVCGLARGWVLRALGWGDLAPLDAWAHTHRAVRRTGQGRLAFCHCTDPTCGVLDQTHLRGMLAAADEAHVDAWLAAGAGDESLRAVGWMLDALRGRNRAFLEKKLKHSTIIAIKAYGLLPLEGQDDLRSRASRLRELQRKASRFGAQRKKNTEAAAEVGLENLARSAGLADAAELALHLDTELTDDGLVGRPHPAGAYTLTLTLAEGGTRPIIVAHNAKTGRALRTVPKKVRQHAIYTQLKERAEALRHLLSRTRRSLEAAMCRERVFTADALARMRRSPVFDAMLRPLLLRLEDGTVGLLDDGPHLYDHDDDPHALDGQAVTIVHPVRLSAEARVGWGEKLADHALLQPFQQVDRDCHPDAGTSPDETALVRYENTPVNGGLLHKLLLERGWRQQVGAHESLAYVRRSPRGTEARLPLPGVYSYFGRQRTWTLGPVCFTRGEEAVPWSTDPVLASECLRDLSLVVSRQPN